ncbi:ATP-dependent DNA helicase II subunit 1 [Grifola frondosa]|uniref:ATP-dependent DNA helicase II subunit 1 n=1 Tax=Grifola frondosa TaxID=5627 RepID=A0A1C7M6Q8_GRIFR|nr:ATP-dependent DNA helicase II subunit 1 [Grifola frondosa]
MAQYDEWTKIEDEEEEEELQDNSFYEGKKDVILFCIDCSPSMLELYDDPRYEDVKTCHLQSALEAAAQIQKRKVVVGPSDSVGIMLFNTTRINENLGSMSEIKKGTFVFQPISVIDAPKVLELTQLLDAARENPNLLRETFPPWTDKRVPMGDVFTSCNWVIRDGYCSLSSYNIASTILMYDDKGSENCHQACFSHYRRGLTTPNIASERLLISAKTTLVDLVQAGVNVEPFFISTEDKPFDVSKFYSVRSFPPLFCEVSLAMYNSMCSPFSFQRTSTNPTNADSENPAVLPESISISRIDELLTQMRFHEVAKRAQFSISFQLAKGFVIGVKGYGLVTEQKKGAYKYFADLGGKMEVATPRTVYVDEERNVEADKTRIVYGMELGATAATEEAEGEAEKKGFGTRSVSLGSRVFYNADEVRAFRTMGMEPIIKLLGFKSRKSLVFEDNVKHSFFIYPDEMSYSGSKRTFSALLKTMLNKKKIALVLALTRRNSSPIFCAMLPQASPFISLLAEKVEETGWHEPPGFHLIPLPFADDIRAAPIEQSVRASDELKDAARKWIDKLNVKNGSYPPDSYPNPALAYHNAQLEASAFREEFDPESFEDLTEPKYDMIHKVGVSYLSPSRSRFSRNRYNVTPTLHRSSMVFNGVINPGIAGGGFMKKWKETLLQDESANTVIVTAGSKRKALMTLRITQDISVDEAEIRSKHEVGMLGKLRVDQLKVKLPSSCDLSGSMHSDARGADHTVVAKFAGSSH